ncbi:MAG: thioredoxin domain-containing protein [Candidatus Nanopelagicaceae bacterium]|nr:thioredoxin domain-containing protein [Candidatus Nanopelagicaceae bacterium]
MAKQSGQSGGDKITRYIVIGMVVFVLAVGVIFSVMGNKASNGAVPSSVSKADGYGIAFNADLKDVPKIDLWEDLQCPVCKQFEATNGDYIQKIITEKKAKVVFHVLSFIGPESILAANAVACSADEGKFLQFHSYLYKTQGSENSGAWSNEGLITAGADAGLSSGKFKNCINNGTYTSWVSDVANDGAAKNINSTPTLFVNGKPLDRNTQYFDAAGFAAAVEGK